MAMCDPHTVYVITDAAPPRTAPAPDPADPDAVRRVRRRWRITVAAALTLSAYVLLPDPYGWWLAGAALGWLVWPWPPRLRRLRHLAAVLLGAADALVSAALGTRRLAYIATLLRQAVAETRRSSPPHPGHDGDDAARFPEGDPS